MDDFDARLGARLRALADAVPVRDEALHTGKPLQPTVRFRVAMSPAQATGILGLVLAVTGLAILNRGAAPDVSGSPLPSVSDSATRSSTDGPIPSASPSASAAPSPAAVLGFRGLPVDPSLKPVSASDPAAAAALHLCVRLDQFPLVAGMAHLPGRDVHRFMLTNGNEPELATDELVWAIQLQGPIQERQFTVIDPLCVVVGAEAFHYVPYGVQGEAFSPPPGFVEPEVALPPLLP
jgi:hypothetical protein